MGGEVRQYRVAPNPAALRALGVTYEQLEKALAQFGVNTGGGFTDQYSREYLIRNIGRTTSLDDLRNLVVANRQRRAGLSASGGRGRVRAPRSSAATPATWASPPSSSRSRSSPNVDTVRLTREIEQALKELTRDAAAGHQGRPDSVPPGQLHRDLDPQRRSACCWKRSLVVAVVLFAFLLNWRTTAISLTAIPVSILTTAIIFYLLGLSINTMTLGGLAIAIGELVDDAVVDVENIFRRLRENRAAGQSALRLRRGGLGLARSPLRHRLCDA